VQGRLQELLTKEGDAVTQGQLFGRTTRRNGRPMWPSTLTASANRPQIFRYASSTAVSITYTSVTAINNLVSGAIENVNSRLVLTLRSGSGIVIDTGSVPANNDKSDVQKLFRISGNAFSVRIDVTSNHLTAPIFGPSNDHIFNQIHTPEPTRSVTSVPVGFYYNQCSP
jgi:hypothetical protein